MVDELRATMAAFPGHTGLGIAHQGAVLLRPGWRHVEHLATGFDNGSIALEHQDAQPHLVARTPYRLEPEQHSD